MTSEFIRNNEQAQKIVNGKILSKMKKGVWALFIQDYRHIFCKLEGIEEIEEILITNEYILSHVWIDGKPYKAEATLKLIPYSGESEMNYDLFCNTVYTQKEK